MNVGWYESPCGRLRLTSDEEGLTSLLFEPEQEPIQAQEQDDEFITQTKQWLDDYFSGNNPDWIPALSLHGSDFQLSVWNHLLQIPYGTYTTYGTIAKMIAREKGIEKMSAQAVGGAVGRNPVCIIVPCHRVLGSDRSLTGYSGGIEPKMFLLDLEGIPYL